MHSFDVVKLRKECCSLYILYICECVCEREKKKTTVDDENHCS